MIEWLKETLYYLPALLIALSVHEFSHAYVAYKLGDRSQKAMGRLTLAPFAHIDIMGFIFMLVFKFGWGRPVVIDDRNFKNKARGTMLVALAGPMSNIILAVLATLVFKLLMICGVVSSLVLNPVGQTFIQIYMYIIQFNVVFGVFNLIILPPFDGSKVLYYFLPASLKRVMENIEKYSIYILIFLMITDLYQILIIPAYNLVASLLEFILNI